MGIMAALAGRERTGEGSFVDVSMLDSLFMLNMGAIPRFAAGNFPGTPSQPWPRKTSGVTAGDPMGLFRCGGGGSGNSSSSSSSSSSEEKTQPNQFIAIAALLDSHFKSMAQIIGSPELCTDERFATPALRLDNTAELTRLMEGKLAARPVAHWLGVFQAAGVPCGAVNGFEELMAHPQLVHRNMLVKTSDGHTTVGNPLKISGFPDSDRRRGVSALNADSAEIRTVARAAAAGRS